MPNYIFAYHGGKEAENPEEAAKHLEKWKAWVNALGNIFANPGTPLKTSTTLSSRGILDVDSDNQLSGFSILMADSMAAALEIAKRCPFLDIGNIEVAEILEK